MHKTDTPGHKKDGHRPVGMFEGDLIMKEIIEEGQRIRKEGRRQAGV